MARHPRPPVPVAVSFIDCINRGDIEGLGALMTAEHTLVVFDEAPLVGRTENIAAWRGYFSSYPAYVIYPSQLAVRGTTVAILGTTTGSHLELSDEDESRLTVVWLAEVDAGAVASWQIVEDTAPTRTRVGLTLA